MSLGEVYIVMFYGCPEHSVKFITIAAVGKIDHIFFQIFALKKNDPCNTDYPRLLVDY